MRKTVGEIHAMGRQGFVDAVVAEMEAKAKNPDLPAEERQRLQRYVDRVKAELAQEGQEGTITRRAA